MRKKYKYILVLLSLAYSITLTASPIFSLSSNLSKIVDDTVSVELKVDSDISTEDVLSYSFSFSYNANILTPIDVLYDQNLQHFSKVNNFNTSGKIILVGASIQKMSGSGTLLTVRFKAKAQGSTALSFITNECVLNEGAVVYTFQNGNVNIAPKPSITLTPNSGFLTLGQNMQFSVSGGTPPYVFEVKDENVAQISSAGVLTALTHGTTKVYATDANGIKDSTDSFIEVTALSLSIPTDLNAWQGWSIEVPINALDFNMLDVFSAQIKLTYRSDVLSFDGVTTEGTLLSNAVVSAVDVAPGNLNIVFASANKLQGEGVLVKLHFKVLTTAVAATNITFSETVFNENIRSLNTNGHFYPSVLPSLTLIPNSGTLVAGDSMLFEVQNGYPPYSWKVSDARIASVGLNGMLTAKEGGVVAVTVTDSVGAEKTIEGIKVYDMKMYFDKDTLEKINTVTKTRFFSDSIPEGRLAVSSIEGEVSVNNPNVRITGIHTDSSFTKDWDVIIVPVNNQRIKFYMAGSESFNQKGVVFFLETELLPGFKEYDKTDIIIHSLIVNESVPEPFLINGSIEGKLFTDQDKTICLGEKTPILTLSGAKNKTISGWQKRVGRTGAWTSIAVVDTFYSEVPSQIGEWEYRVVVDGIPEKVANIIVKTIPYVSGSIKGPTSFCNVPQFFTYKTDPIKTASSYLWTYTGSGVVLHPNKNKLLLEITNDITPGFLILKTENMCGKSLDSLVLFIDPLIQPANFDIIKKQQTYNRDTVDFENSSIGALSYHWIVNAQEPSVSFVKETNENSENISLQFNQAGIYQVKLITTNSCRVDSVSQQIEILPFKNGKLVVDKTEACLGETFHINLTETTGEVQSWQIQKAQQIENIISNSLNEIFYSPSASDVFSISAMLKEDRGYSDTISIETIQIPSKPNIYQEEGTLFVNSSLLVRWYEQGDDDLLFEGDTLLTLIPNTTYVATVSDRGCESPISNPIHYVNVRNVDADLFSVFPNPIKNRLYVNSQYTVEKITIKDVTGKLCYEQEGKSNIDVSQLSSGIYLFEIKLKDNNNIYIKKLIKE